MTLAAQFIANYSLQRIEVDKATSEGEQSHHWSYRSVSDDSRYAFVIGHLRVRAEKGFGQALAFVTIEPADIDLEEVPDGWGDEAVEWAKRTCLDPLYSIARRSLEAQASAMDFQFDLPGWAVPEYQGKF